MTNKNNIFLYLILILFTSLNSLGNSLKIIGLSKLNLNDIQTLTSIELSKEFYTDEDINLLLKDLYKSDLIFDLNYSKEDNTHIINIEENRIIENIFINGNKRINDELILQNISMKKKGFIKKNSIKDDIKIIKNIYRTKGFNNVIVIISSEKYSSDRVNLIYEIIENNQSLIERIKFTGNTSFSDRYLLSLINTKSKNFYNIFSSGSNLNIENFNFDVNKIKFFYKQKGFFNVEVNFNISESSSNTYTVNFYINEGDRFKLDDIKFESSKSNISKIIDKNFDKFLKKIEKNNFYYDQSIVDEFTGKINNLLIKNNIFNTIYFSSIEEKDDNNVLFFKQERIKPTRINKIDIIGNNITQDKTIRSKLKFIPGDYFNKNLIRLTKNDLLKYKYINSVSISDKTNEGKSDIIINIDENEKTGQILAGGTFSGDNGAGITLSAKDNNIFGSGNSLDTNFTANEERTLFKISLIQYPVSSSYITNRYSIFNTELDLSNSFGFKTDDLGIRYSINFDYDEVININTGIAFKKSDSHSAKKSISSINDNIGKSDIYSINLTLRQDSTNDFLYPTDGSSNSLFIEYSPKDISDDSYYKFILKSDLYKKSKNSNRFIFLSNDFGFADSLEGNLRTVNAFSLGGLNFKGFEYRGVGPKQSDIYLGGNKFFTSTIGYGGSFLFDDKDNINTKLFYSLGSIWDSDYTNENDMDIRSSVGISFDILTTIGPISLSYAIPIDKNINDKTSEFNFSIGTSF